MGIFDALNTSVGGLEAQSFALQNIAGNIANASTVGYKGIDTTFEDLIPGATTPSEQVAGGVMASALATITTDGTATTTSVATNMAINGDGFFQVQTSTGTTDNVPVFSGTTDYTRRGDFQLNANGNLVNGAGYYLMGEAVDPKTGNVTGSVPTVLQFQNNFIAAQPTTSISYAANLPSSPTTTESATAPAGTITALGGLNPYDFSVNPLSGTAAMAASSGALTGTAVTAGSPAAAITTGTVLDTLSTPFTNGETLTVLSGSPPTTSTITFGTTGTDINPTTATVQTLLTAIDTISGTTTPSSVNANGQITLESSSTSNLTITPSNSAQSAFAALGFTGTGVTVDYIPALAAGTGTVVANDQQTFLNESISGGAVTAYDQTGTPVNIELRWAMTDNASLGAGHTNTWNLFYESDPSATGIATAWTNVGTNFTFGPSGVLTSPATPAITITGLTVGSQTLGNVSFGVGAGSLTQYASTSGTATVNSVTQNGYAAGQLQSVAINNNGIVVGTFSNGQNLDLASVTLAHFNGTNYLQALDGGAYAVTEESGLAIQGASGTISGSSLENSNTDIATEFTKLIVTQQAYSANTKVITTANDMVQDLLNVLR